MCAVKEIKSIADTLEDENYKIPAVMTKTDIADWNIELRTNNMCMDEQNADERKKRFEGIERVEVQRRQERDKTSDDRERANMEKEKTITDRESISAEKERTNVDIEAKHADREWMNDVREISIVYVY